MTFARKQKALCQSLRKPSLLLTGTLRYDVGTNEVLHIDPYIITHPPLGQANAKLSFPRPHTFKLLNVVRMGAIPRVNAEHLHHTFKVLNDLGISLFKFPGFSFKGWSSEDSIRGRGHRPSAGWSFEVPSGILRHGVLCLSEIQCSFRESVSSVLGLEVQDSPRTHRYP